VSAFALCLVFTDVQKYLLTSLNFDHFDGLSVNFPTFVTR